MALINKSRYFVTIVPLSTLALQLETFMEKHHCILFHSLIKYFIASSLKACNRGKIGKSNIGYNWENKEMLWLLSPLLNLMA